MNLTLKVWRQANRNSTGHFETYQVKDISSEMSFLEMFDVLNESLVREGKDAIAFDHDCMYKIEVYTVMIYNIDRKTGSKTTIGRAYIKQDLSVMIDNFNLEEYL